MGVAVEYDCFESESDALALLQSAGMHTMALAVPPVNNSTHWHHFDSVFFILEGSLELTDAASGVTHQCRLGCRISVPAKALHYELSTTGYRIALGTSVPASEFGEPVNLPPATLNVS
ncbi:MAG: hypothetical protein ACR2PZ_05990 [Pseudomonadales bacterium]